MLPDAVLLLVGVTGVPRRSSLPKADDPLLLPDGSAVSPSTAQTFRGVEVPSNSEAVRIVSSTRRKLADMPALPKQMNSYAVVLCYTASGLSDSEIAVATGFTQEQISRLREQPAYTQLESMITDAVKEQSANAVKEILVRGEVSAANKLVNLVNDNDPTIALRAASNLLDRGGHKAAERLEINARMQQTFRIEVVDKRENDAPVIDMEAE